MKVSGIITSFELSSGFKKGSVSSISGITTRRSLLTRESTIYCCFKPTSFISSFHSNSLAMKGPVSNKFKAARYSSNSEEVNRERYSEQLLHDFGMRTGLTDSSQPQKRYLWTDAFAVFGYLGLYQITNKIIHLDNATALVKQVHEVLGKHRKDDMRSGWISGLSEEEAKIHPTIGGLRIGKEKNERKQSEAFVERNEWNQDGQYFHYLTKWMRALEAVARATGKDGYLEWSIELAKKARSSFVYDYGPHHGIKRMYWKMSIDLSHPLVKYMGKHDPIDGYSTIKLLKASSRNRPTRLHSLEAELKDFTDMVAPMRNFETTDCLGIGGLLTDTFTLVQVMILEDTFHEQNNVLKHIVRNLLISIETSLCLFASIGEIGYDADARLPFRELGLSIGLRSLEKLRDVDKDEWVDDEFRSEVEGTLSELSRYFNIAKNIEDFWMDEKNQQSQTWIDHKDINSVMLAVSLVPDGYLNIVST